MGRKDRATAVKDRLDPARDRVFEIREDVRERLMPARQRAAATGTDLLERLEPTLDRAQHRARKYAEVARERGGDLGENLEPTARRIGSGMSTAAKTGAVALAAVPGLAAQLSETVAHYLEDLSERGREAAYQIEPPKSVRRRSRARTFLWFLSGLLLGALGGFVAREMFDSFDEDPATGSAPDLPVRPASVQDLPDSAGDDIDIAGDNGHPDSSG